MVKTDHNSLRHFLTQKEPNDRHKKWVSKVQAYDFDIEYKKGKKNVIAYFISIKLTLPLMEVPNVWKSQLEI